MLEFSLLVFGGGCDSVDTSDPESVARAAITALGSGDVDNVCQYFTGTAYGRMAEGLPDLYLQIGKVRVDNITVATTRIDGDIATLHVSYDISGEVYGHEETAHVAKKVQAIEQYGEWFLSSPL